MNTSCEPGSSRDRGPGPALTRAVIAELGAYRLTGPTGVSGGGPGPTEHGLRATELGGGGMSLPVRVYRAELVTLARFAGQLITTGTSSPRSDPGSMLVLSIDNPVLARRARWLVTTLTEGDCTVDERLPHAQSGQLLITGAVRRLSLRLGLLDGRGRTVRGLPPAVVADPAVEVAAAIWRAALLHETRLITHPVGASTH